VSSFLVELYRAALLEADRILARGELGLEELDELAATLERIRAEVYRQAEGVDRARA
jgi:hypothetical protein